MRTPHTILVMILVCTVFLGYQLWNAKEKPIVSVQDSPADSHSLSASKHTTPQIDSALLLERASADYDDVVAPSSESHDETLMDDFPRAIPEAEASDANHSPTTLMSKISDAALLEDSDSLSTAQAELLEKIHDEPELVDQLMTAYADLDAQAEQRLVRTLLASVDDPAIEELAVARIADATDEDTLGAWLDLIAQKGVQLSTSRHDLISVLPQLADPTHLRSAILALSPSVVSVEERSEVAAELTYYATHMSQQVRSASVEMVARWGDPGHAHVIEDALFDSAPSVRSAALFAAYASTLRTPGIKRSLLKIMSDRKEAWDFRMEAYAALSSYMLDEDEHDAFYEFELERKSVYEDEEGVRS